MENNTTASGSSSDGFISSVSSGIGAGIGSIFQNILPVWTAKQAGLAKTDPLDQSTYVSRDDVARLNPGPTTGARTTVQGAVSGLGLANVGIGVIAGIAVLAGLAAYLILKK